ncbi:MAG: hypothetical protein OEY91_08505 [Nitrospirota bacterium]|nr:hypothetical protein [Nitrospirota bacterium]
MNTNKSGLLHGMAVNETHEKSKHKKLKVCVHQRMVDSHFNAKGLPSGNFVCRECGEVIPDPVKIFG